MKPQNNIQKELTEIKELLNSQRAEKPLNLFEAAEYLSISKSSLYKLTSRKQIAYYKPNGKLIFFKKSELDRWILRNRHKTVDEIDAEAQKFVNGKR